MIYDYSNIENLFVLGDIHGEFKTLFNNIKQRLPKTKPKKIEIDDTSEINDAYQVNDIDLDMDITLRDVYMKKNNVLDNSVLIVAGDCGFGFNKYQYYIDVLAKANEILNDNNTHLLFVRGNHDDPSYFSEQKIDLSNIKCIPDYSIVKTKNNTTLCVGGAISIDRVWRKSQEHQINKYSKNKVKKLYWDDEAPIYDESALRAILDSGIQIDSVVTHSSTPKMYPVEKDYKYWLRIDKKLSSDVPNERETLGKIYDFLLSNGCKIKFWAYGHFHEYEMCVTSDEIFYVALPDNFTPYNINKLVNKFSEKPKVSFDDFFISNKIPLF